MDAKTWAKGLLAALIGSAANGILVVVVNPGTFDIFSVPGWKNIATVCAASALIAGAMYLKQSPLPGQIKIETTKLTVTEEVTNTSETQDDDDA